MPLVFTFLLFVVISLIVYGPVLCILPNCSSIRQCTNESLQCQNYCNSLYIIDVGACKCYDCSNVGMFSLPCDIPFDLDVFVFTNNNIGGTLTCFQLPLALTVLDFSNNAITDLQVEPLVGMLFICKFQIFLFNVVYIIFCNRTFRRV